MNASAAGSKVSTEHLAPQHRDSLFLGIRNVLNTEIAEDAMAQLLDGLPRYNVATNTYGNMLSSQHPLHEHQETCSAALTGIRQFRDLFDPRQLHFDTVVCLLRL